MGGKYDHDFSYADYLRMRRISEEKREPYQVVAEKIYNPFYSRISTRFYRKTEIELAVYAFHDLCTSLEPSSHCRFKCRKLNPQKLIEELIELLKERTHFSEDPIKALEKATDEISQLFGNKQELRLLVINKFVKRIIKKQNEYLKVFFHSNDIDLNSVQKLLKKVSYSFRWNRRFSFLQNEHRTIAELVQSKLKEPSLLKEFFKAKRTLYRKEILKEINYFNENEQPLKSLSDVQLRVLSLSENQKLISLSQKEIQKRNQLAIKKKGLSLLIVTLLIVGLSIHLFYRK